MMRGAPALILLLAVLAVLPVRPLHAEEALPIIREIAFAGNKHTEPKVMLREMFIEPGDPADPEKIERSRQGVQDLGLFRDVKVEQQPVAGGVRLLFTVKEKFYILPLPSASANSDGAYSYGFRARWYNAWGLNHTFLAYYQKRKLAEGPMDPVKRGEQTRYQMRYSAPFIADTPFGLGIALAREVTPYLQPATYESTVDAASVTLSRKLGGRMNSQGWDLSGGLGWNRESNAGPGAPPDQGRSTDMVGAASYRDLRYNLYSDEGITFGVTATTATRDVLSDYSSTSWTAHYAQYVPVGDTPHQTLNLLASTATRRGGPGGADYSLGGVESLRGYDPETVQGDSYYLLSTEFVRPVFRNSIRAVAVLDAGSMVEKANTPYALVGDGNIGKVLVSAGLGLRFRIQAFVNLEVEVGVAWPVEGGPYRIFASKV